MVLERTLESPLDCKEIKSVNPKGNQSWIFIGGTDAEADALILWPPDAKNCLLGKDPDAGKDWRQEEKGNTEDEMFGRHHHLNGHEFEETLGDGEGQGSLVCFSPWNWTQLRDWTTTAAIWCLFFSFWFISLYMTDCTSIHISKNEPISLLCMAE